MELPNAPFYRRWSFILASVIGLAAITALVGWRGLQQVNPPAAATATTVPATTITGPTTTLPPSSTTTTSKPDDVLWSREAKDLTTLMSPGFRAPSVWRIEWSFDCSNFKRYNGGNFKITGNGAFGQLQIQKFDIKASGTQTFKRSGYGRLLVDSVCKRWSVKALTGSG
jgi:hypothetical protein